MKTPLILCLNDSGEARLSQDLESLESAIEAIDLSNSEYMAFDAEGMEIELTVDRSGRPKAAATGISKEEKLRMWISANYAENPEISAERGLSEMVRVLERVHGYPNIGRRPNWTGVVLSLAVLVFIVSMRACRPGS